MYLKKITVTPEMAKQYMIESKVHNRRLNKERIKGYANAMRAGGWKTDTGESLIFSKSLGLIDGFHRLAATILFNDVVLFNAIFDADDDSLPFINTGKSRTPGDLFEINEIKNSNTISAMVRKYLILCENKKQLKNSSNSQGLTNEMILNEYNSNTAKWQEILKYSVSCYNAFSHIIPPTLIGAIFAYMSSKNANAARHFIDCLTKSEGHISGMSLLRKRLISDKTSIKKMPIGMKVNMILDVWDKFIRNNSLGLK